MAGLVGRGSPAWSARAEIVRWLTATDHWKEALVERRHTARLR